MSPATLLLLVLSPCRPASAHLEPCCPPIQHVAWWHSGDVASTWLDVGCRRGSAAAAAGVGDCGCRRGTSKYKKYLVIRKKDTRKKYIPGHLEPFSSLPPLSSTSLPCPVIVVVVEIVAVAVAVAVVAVAVVDVEVELELEC